jgi:hypothetical protein
MVSRPQIECDVHDLLDEVNVALLIHRVASPVTDELLRRLKQCADRALVIGRHDIADRLNDAAGRLESRFHAV